MPSPTRAELKAFFETGDVPTQEQMGELVDKVFDGDQDVMTVANAAADDAAAALETVQQYSSKCFATLKGHAIGGGSYEWIVDNAAGCTIVLSGASNKTVTVTFDTALLDDKFTCVRDTSVGAVTVTSRSDATVVFTLSLAPAGVADRFEFVIFR